MRFSKVDFDSNIHRGPFSEMKDDTESMTLKFDEI